MSGSQAAAWEPPVTQSVQLVRMPQMTVCINHLYVRKPTIVSRCLNFSYQILEQFGQNFSLGQKKRKETCNHSEVQGLNSWPVPAYVLQLPPPAASNHHWRHPAGISLEPHIALYLLHAAHAAQMPASDIQMTFLWFRIETTRILYMHKIPEETPQPFWR